jgi:hypothetical protein
MSAYALPGSFFFPSTLEEPNSIVASSKNDLLKNVDSNSSKEKDSWYKPNDLLISIKSASIDHIRLIQGFTARRSSIGSRRSSFRDRVASRSNSLSGFSLASSFTEADENWGEYMEDEEEEEQQQHGQEENFYTNHSNIPTSPRQRKVQFQFDELDKAISNRRESVTSLDGTVCAASVCGEQAAFPTLRDSSVQSHSQDDAIQFTLSITLNGRKYTATRALPSFVKLRQDLLQELETKKSSPSRLQRSGRIPNVDGKKNDSLFQPGMDALQQDNEEVVIPELPIGGNAADSDKSGGLIGMAGRGFRGLQDTVKNYCPPMEHWIRSVAALVPSSPTLANFLWEPLHCSNQDQDDVTEDGTCASSTKPSQSGRRVSLRNSIRGSVQTLISITESADTDSADRSEGDKDVTPEESSRLDEKEDFVVS